MFCYQCEQAAKGKGCDLLGICGKNEEVAALQDILVHQLKGIAAYAHAARSLGGKQADLDRFALEALFVTVTNVNFDPARIEAFIRKAGQVRDQARALYEKVSKGHPAVRFPASSSFAAASDRAGLLRQAAALTILLDDSNEDLRSLKHLLLFGVKGLAAYAEHALLLGKTDETIFAFVHEALSALNDPLSADALLGLNLRCGQVNIRCMEILDEAHTGRYGHPVPTPVSTALKAGPAIVISGHDLLDLEELLKQTEGKGVNVYTHGEMLPAHGYPGLKKYPHLVGHFGTAWQNQQTEFENVPAAFYFTTNCIQEPRASYRDRVFTGGVVGWPGIPHVEKRDFSGVIRKAIGLGGFKETPGKTLLTGFGRDAVLKAAGKVVELVKAGKIRHFFLIGGCDGAKPGRNYYTELAEQTPKDTMILTLACGKFRFNSLSLGEIDGLPRLLDVGQCNDAYSAVKIAQALSGAFQCGVNDLPLTLFVSWYEQKAVAVLLSLLALGIKGIRLGPTLPAFLSPNIVKALVERFDLRLGTNAREDLEVALAK